jgi:hypothetical protein
MLFTSTAGHHESLFGTIAQRWREWKSTQDSLARLESCGRNEVARIAQDLALTTTELRSLAGKGADAANLLYRRMANIGLDRAELARQEPMVLWDMQKNCSLCASKKRCRNDFDAGAQTSAWQAYCPNDDTLGALALQTVGAANRGHAGTQRAMAGTAIADDDHRGRLASLLGLLLVGLAWLILLGAPPAGLRFDHQATSAPDRATSAPDLANVMSAPPVTCLDASCLSAAQQAALRDLRTVQTQGLIASTPDQIASLPAASLIAQEVHAGEALACARQGGTTHYGLMFQNGCNQGSLEAARLDGYDECRPMSGGGVCFTK